MSVAAIVIGIVLFVVTLIYIDLDETLASAGRLGLALPVILLPATIWQLLRTWGWAVAFPDETRPPFTRLLRVRLAADAIGFFTIRGIAGEPLKVVLLYDRVAPEVTTAAIALERLAFAVIGTIIAALISLVRRHAPVDAGRVGHDIHDAHFRRGDPARRSSASWRAAAPAIISDGWSPRSTAPQDGASKPPVSSGSSSTSRTCCCSCCAATGAG